MARKRGFPWAVMWAIAALLSLLYLSLLLLPNLPLVAPPLIFLALAIGAGALAVAMEPDRSVLAAWLGATTAALLAYGGLFVIALILEGGPFQVNIRGQKIGGARQAVEGWDLLGLFKTIMIGLAILVISLAFGAVAAAAASVFRSLRRRRRRRAVPAAVMTNGGHARWNAIATIVCALIAAVASVVSAILSK